MIKKLSRLRVYDINDQDGLYSYIRQEFPEISYILARAPEEADIREGVYLGGEESFASREWIDKNVRRDHGSLGELYPHKTWTAPNPHGAPKEGDTLSFSALDSYDMDGDNLDFNWWTYPEAGTST